MKVISENIVGVPKRFMTKNYGLKRGEKKGSVRSSFNMEKKC
jgi:hypothetical protein